MFQSISLKTALLVTLSLKNSMSADLSQVPIFEVPDVGEFPLLSAFFSECRVAAFLRACNGGSGDYNPMWPLPS